MKVKTTFRTNFACVKAASYRAQTSKQGEAEMCLSKSLAETIRW